MGDAVHEILMLVAYTQKPQINAHADLYWWARVLNFCPSLHLQPYFVYTSGAGSGESAQTRLA